MEQTGFDTRETENRRRSVINFCVLLVLFVIYALTFTIAKFYDMINIVYSCAGVVNFVMLTVLFFNNAVFPGKSHDGTEAVPTVGAGPVRIPDIRKEKGLELYILAAVTVIAGVNLIIVDSGKGAFFVPVNFILIWYLSDKLYLSLCQLKAFAWIYAGFIVFYLFIAYPRLFTTFDNYKYNTNTAATFMIYTILCAFILLQMMKEKSPVTGLFMVMILLKGFQLSLWHRARGAFVMIILFMVFMYVIPKKLWGSRVFYTVMCVLATAGSLMFVGLYVLIGTTGANFKLPFFYKEVFSGREAIWKELFGLLTDPSKPYMLFTGIGTNFELTSFFEKNVHNAMYNFVVIHGIVVFAGILFFIFKRLLSFRMTVAKNAVAMCAMCALMAVFFESWFDVDLIWADYALNLMFLLCVINSSGKGGPVPEKDEAKEL
ncbi:MAG: hypothetical protein K6F34_02410 [Lachnospiraceae bacterium]|nr:hypothetical protein [Lachnospiraceae bacterium]